MMKSLNYRLSGKPHSIDDCLDLCRKEKLERVVIVLIILMVLSMKYIFPINLVTQTGLKRNLIIRMTLIRFIPLVVDL